MLIVDTAGRLHVDDALMEELEEFKRALSPDEVLFVANSTTGQDAEGLVLLNRFVDSLYGMELGEFVADWPVPPGLTSPVPARFPIQPKNESVSSDQWPYPPANVRVIMKLVADTTLYLPQSPDDGARIELVNIGGASGHSLTLDANGRFVRGALTSTDTDVLWNTVRLLYRADLSDWIAVSTLAEGDSSPFPEFYDDLLAIGTFIRLAPRYGKTITPELGDTFSRLMKKMRAQVKQRQPMPSAKPQPFFLPSSDQARKGFRFGSRLF